MKNTYEKEANKLAKAIDIAIEAVKKFPPKDYSSEHIKIFIKTYLDFKKNALNPKPKFKTLASLKYNIQNTFIFFQEGSGKTVDFFWNEIKNCNLPYKRENKLKKIIAKKRIKNHLEYEYVIDTIVPFEQENIINKEDIAILNQLISNFENKKAKKN